jgi:hypothetical protein
MSNVPEFDPLLWGVDVMVDDALEPLPMSDIIALLNPSGSEDALYNFECTDDLGGISFSDNFLDLERSNNLDILLSSDPYRQDSSRETFCLPRVNSIEGSFLLDHTTPTPIQLGMNGIRFQDCLSEFVGTVQISPNINATRRKPFSPTRRKEVGQVRKAGACLRCKLTKTTVSFS